MTTPRGIFRLAAPIVVLVGLVANAGTTAGASIPAGSWMTPTANSTVAGSNVSLEFSTNQSAVTFVLPTGNENATVSGGVAYGTFDSTKVSNGSVTLGAMECDVVTGCSTTNETVTVANATTPTPSPSPSQTPVTFTPASGSVAPGSTVTVNGSGTADVDVTIDGSAVLIDEETLPFAYQTPTNLTQGDHGLAIAATVNGASFSAGYTIVVPDTTPPVISKLYAPPSYFPVKDGYLDHFYVLFSTNETSTARLVILKAGKVVSEGDKQISNPEINDLRVGVGLKPGHYQWQLTVTDAAGNATTTPARNLLADPRHTVSHHASKEFAAGALNFHNISGSCSTVKKSGTSVVFASDSKCTSSGSAYFDVALANFFPVLNTAADYGNVSVAIASHGSFGRVQVFDFAEQTFNVARDLHNGVTTLRLSEAYIGYPKPILALGIGTSGGKTLTVSSLTVSYVYKTLSKK